jgi:hypothetical protein
MANSKERSRSIANPHVGMQGYLSALRDFRVAMSFSHPDDVFGPRFALESRSVSPAAVAACSKLMHNLMDQGCLHVENIDLPQCV